MKRPQEKLEAYIERTLLERGYRLQFGAYVRERDTMIVSEEMTFREVPSHELHEPAGLVLRDGEAQRLMDELWRAGIRPSNGEGNVGQIGALRAHCADLRTVAFHALKIPERKP